MSWSGERDRFQLTARIQWRCPMSADEPQGYDYGAVTKSPVSWDDFEDLKRVLGFSDRDQQLLLRAGEMIGPRLEELLGHWLEQLGPGACHFLRSRRRALQQHCGSSLRSRDAGRLHAHIRSKMAGLPARNRSPAQPCQEEPY